MKPPDKRTLQLVKNVARAFGPCAPTSIGTTRLSGQQRECIESMDQADQHPGALVGEQPQRWRARPETRSASEIG